MRAQRVEEAIEYLDRVYCSLDDACNALGFEEEDLTSEELTVIDNEVFQCISCGSWYRTSEGNDLHDEIICNNCLDN